MIESIRPAADGAAAVAVTSVVMQGQTQILGLPGALLLACFAGALFGLARTNPEAWGSLLSVPPGSPGRRAGWVMLRAAGLATTLSGIAFCSGWAVFVLPHVEAAGMTPFGWMADVPMLPLGGTIAFAFQTVFPRAVAAVERWFDRRGVAQS